DKQLETLMDSVIPVIAASQRPDGYIHTPVMIAARHAKAGVKEFVDKLNFETYNMGHLMTAACVHYRATVKRTLLDIG
ncbi:beta-L-arabinofuranosidase domain-containing protein, partial [Chitinophaga sp. GbtcB8]|uniref:beta-L-arabinofuranosidase domain-containing protein n=1 Tax=Chitinophaga sp. GbtcB8 TaxID=2824753 RepID=UPI001C309166